MNRLYADFITAYVKECLKEKKIDFGFDLEESYPNDEEKNNKGFHAYFTAKNMFIEVSYYENDTKGGKSIYIRNVIDKRIDHLEYDNEDFKKVLYVLFGDE